MDPTSAQQFVSPLLGNTLVVLAVAGAAAWAAWRIRGWWHRLTTTKPPATEPSASSSPAPDCLPEACASCAKGCPLPQ